MADDPKNKIGSFGSLLEGLAETALELSAGELKTLCEDEGREPESVIQNMRGLLQKAEKQCAKARLQLAAKQYHNRINEFSRRQFTLPRTHEGKRNLLFAVLKNNPEFRNGLTLQHREFSTITDEEVENYLKQLIVLGVISPEDGEPDE